MCVIKRTVRNIHITYLIFLLDISLFVVLLQKKELAGYFLIVMVTRRYETHTHTYCDPVKRSVISQTDRVRGRKIAPSFLCTPTAQSKRGPGAALIGCSRQMLCRCMFRTSLNACFFFSQAVLRMAGKYNLFLGP